MLAPRLADTPDATGLEVVRHHRSGFRWRPGWKSARNAGLLLIGVLVPLLAAGESLQFDAVSRESGPVTAARAAALQQERTGLALALDQVQVYLQDLEQQISALTPELVTPERLERARVRSESKQIELDDQGLRLDRLVSDIGSTRKSLAELQSRRQLLENPAAEMLAGADRHQELERLRLALADLTELLAWYRAREKIAEQRVALAGENLQAAARWLGKLNRFGAAAERSQATSRSELARRTDREATAYLRDAEAARRELLDQSLPAYRRRLLETRADVDEQRASVARADGRIVEVNNELLQIADALQEERPQTGELRVALRDVGELVAESQRGLEIFDRWIEVSDKRRALLERRVHTTKDSQLAGEAELELIDVARAELEGRQLQIQDILSRALTLQQEIQLSYEELTRRGLLTRRVLPQYGTELLILGGRVMQAPRLIGNQIWLSVEFMAQDVAGENRWIWAQLVFAILLLVWLIIRLQRWLFRLRRIFRIQMRRRDRFGDDISMLLVRLLRRIIIPAGVALAILLTVMITDLEQPGRGIILTVLALALAARTLGQLAWLLMADPHLSEEQCNPGLHRRVQIVVWMGALVVGLSMLGQLAGVSEAVQDVLDRVVMLILLVSAPIVLRVRRFVTGLLAGAYHDKFWFVSVRVVSLVVVWIPVAAALLGIVGYLDLAWRVLGGLGMFVAAMLVWLVLRGLLDDLVVYLKNLAVRRSEYGLLWTQDIIAPLHRIVRIVLFLTIAYALVWVYGGEAVELIGDSLMALLEVGLFSVGGSPVSALDIMVLLISLLLVVRFGQWLRSITYRWVYSGVMDLGIRNSLSAFTQYALVLIGVLVLLNTVGIDLTAFTVFAGALGVGLGIGMQNVANNFVSGILLLVERPLKTGDWVEVAGAEGVVGSIGMRSLTVNTWDNKEVIIPNAEVISNSFSNWTHADKVLRTVLYIRVAHDADLERVRGLMQEVLERHPEVLDDPSPAVFLWEFAESSINFRVQFFGDIEQYHPVRLRSDVLFGIWNALRDNGIRVPYPQTDLHVKELPPWPPGSAPVS